MHSIHAIIIVLIKLWAASAIVSGLLNFSPIVFGIDPHDNNFSFFAEIALNSVVWVICGFVAWFVAPKVAKIICVDTKKSEINVSVDADTIVMIGGFLIGGLYIVQYLPSLISYLVTYIYNQSTAQVSSSLSPGRYIAPFDTERVIKEGLILLFAMLMFVRPSHLVRIFARIRYIGLYTEESKS